MSAAPAPSRLARPAGAALGLALGLLCALPAAAPAQTSDPGLFSITPARRSVTARPPVQLGSTRVSNTTRSRLEVTVFTVLLRQQLDGAFVFGGRPRQLLAARTILGASPRRFALAPGGQRDVGLSWQLLPRKARAAYMGVVFQAVARQRARSVGVVSRLLSVNFLRLPGRYASRGSFTGMRVEQLGQRTLRLKPRVRNSGQRVDAPRRGQLAIRDAAGRLVYKRRWTGDVVLPGAEREFSVDVGRRLAAGRYTASARMRFGRGRRARTSRRFELVAPGRLASPRLALESLQARGTIGGEAHVTGVLRSIGTSTARTRVGIELYPFRRGVQASRPAVTKTAAFAGLAPRSRRELEASLGSVHRGHYRVRVTYADQPGSSQALLVDFTATPKEGVLRALEQLAKRHEVLLVLLAALLALGALTMVMLRRQRLLAARLAIRAPQPRPRQAAASPAPRRPHRPEHALAGLALAAVTVAVLRRGRGATRR